MRKYLKSALVLGLVALGSAASSQAAVITLTFDSLQNSEQVLDYYNGGTGGMGSGPGPNYGIAFASDALAIDGGNYSGNPSPPGILVFLSGPGAIMNVAAGFDTGFSFYYSAARNPGVVDVYDGLNGSGTLLATLVLPVTPTLPGGGGDFNNWVPIGVAFAGVARSVNFSGTANQIGFDNVTLGSETPAVPEPSSFILAGLGVLGTLAYRGRRRI